MNIVIACATDMELSHLKRVLDEEGAAATGYLLTGVGLTAATAAIMRMALTAQPALIIQVGIAGSFNPGISIGDAVVVQEELVADMGVEENNGYKDIFELGLEEKNKLPYVNGKLINPHQLLLRKTGLQLVSAVSVNEITVGQKKIDRFVQHYGAEVESMEGMALHHVCLLQEIPFLQIRGISNRVGDRDKSTWQIREAMQSAAQTCASLLKSPDLLKQQA